MRLLLPLLTGLVLAGCANDISIGRTGCPEIFYKDRDQDGFGDPDSAAQGEPANECAMPSNWIKTGDDCNDENPFIHPDTVWYEDSDGDGEGNPDVSVIMCAPGEGWVLNDDDCDDTDPDANSSTKWYVDNDGDDWGIEGNYVEQCPKPAGHTSQVGDCDDDNDAIHPDATEICNEGIDDDCDGLADEEDPSLDFSTALVQFFDGDGDGYGLDDTMIIDCEAEILRDHVLIGGDCVDDDFLINPGADEICNEIDDDCDGYIDDDDDNLMADEIVYRDRDGDSFGDPDTIRPACTVSMGFVTNELDCDDSDADTFPGAAPFDSPEGCLKDHDDDEWGDEDVDVGVQPGTDCDDDDAGAWPGAAPMDSEVACMRDNDGDGFGDAEPPGERVTAGTDCNDYEIGANPSMDETCTTAFDDDCDGEINEGDAIDAELWYPDTDGDGHGTGEGIRTCSPPPLHARSPDDCDDSDDAIHPGAEEWCNGRDDDCNTIVDDDYALDARAYYPDEDLDGFGAHDGEVRYACERPERHAVGNADCDDSHNGVYPGAPELCDGEMNDCELEDWTSEAELGLISYEDEDGFWTDATADYDWTDPFIPDPWYAEVSGTLHMCQGIYYGRIYVQRDINLTVVGSGPDETTWVGHDGSGTIVASELDTKVSLYGLSLEDANRGTGGAVYISNGELTIDNCVFRNNSAGLTGGAITGVNLDEALITNTTFETNEVVSFSGGAVSFSGCTLVTIEDSTFTGNRSNGFNNKGGAIETVNSEQMIIRNTIFEDNFADYGGAIGMAGGAGDDVRTESCTFLRNASEKAGGAVRTDGGTYVDIGSTYDGNVGQLGGAVNLVEGDDHELIDSIFLNNEADEEGGAVRGWTAGGSHALEMTNVLIEGNTAVNGGGVAVQGMNITMTGGAIILNEVLAGIGAGVVLNEGTFTASGVNFGAGVDDNEDAEDVWVSTIDAIYTYGGAASFSCDVDGCL